MVCSIFIASMTISGWPLVTSAPTTSTAMMARHRGDQLAARSLGVVGPGQRFDQCRAGGCRPDGTR